MSVAKRLVDDLRAAAPASTMVFVGVTATRSSINRVFPAWAPLLGIDSARLLGVDVELGVARKPLREVVSTIRECDAIAGALVTTHKVAVFQSCADLFDEIGDTATTLGEISCISKRDGRLVGSALDVLTSGFALDELLAPRGWPDGADALIFGSGGSATALLCNLGRRPPGHRPGRIVLSGRRQERLDHVRHVYASLGLSIPVEVVLAESTEVNDRSLAAIGKRSLVVNATGLGKDMPGSPISDQARFPVGAIAWDFNYRGDLLFLEQARRQAASRSVRAVDGWRYFLHGWTQHMAAVFGIEPGAIDARFAQLAATAEAAR